MFSGKDSAGRRNKFEEAGKMSTKNPEGMEKY
jgi:hypothetical protein